MPSPELSSDIHYQNYGHHGLFPVITLRLAAARLLLAGFLVADCYWPMADQRQVYILGWVIYKETTNPTRFPITALQAGLCSIGDRGVFVFVRPTFCICPAELLYLSFQAFVFVLPCCLVFAVLWCGCGEGRCNNPEYSALESDDCYHLLRLLLRLSHKQGLQCSYKTDPCFHSSRLHSSLHVNIAFIIH